MCTHGRGRGQPCGHATFIFDLQSPRCVGGDGDGNENIVPAPRPELIECDDGRTGERLISDPNIQHKRGGGRERGIKRGEERARSFIADLTDCMSRRSRRPPVI